MGKKASLSVAQGAQVVPLSNMKLSERQIAKTCKVSRAAERNAIKKFKKEGTFAGKKRTGHIRIFSSRKKAPNEEGTYSLSHDFCTKNFFSATRKWM